MKTFTTLTSLTITPDGTGNNNVSTTTGELNLFIPSNFLVVGASVIDNPLQTSTSDYKSLAPIWLAHSNSSSFTTSERVNFLKLGSITPIMEAGSGIIVDDNMTFQANTSYYFDWESLTDIPLLQSNSDPHDNYRILLALFS